MLPTVMIMDQTSEAAKEGSGGSHRDRGFRDSVQREIPQDWAEQEYTEIVTSSTKKISDFLSSFNVLSFLQDLKH
ncbi:hypothetical protein U0070_020309 [Myodes glareolus]|uniref:Uncharacterized protein n=1 Tax=Myodes glareolus TaxID=447135 RepID=A0AAW0H409_MYOGA